MTKKPHIIIFNPDEMRSDALAHLGNPAAITPNFDRFTEDDAVSFRHAFCQNPVCVPSRCSFFTGLYPHVRGHRTMSHLLRPGETSLFSQMMDSGYYVWMNGRNDLYAAQNSDWLESNAHEIFYGGNIPKPCGTENPNPRGEAGGKEYYSHFYGKLKTDADGKNYTSDDESVDEAIKRLLNPVDDRPICAFIGLMYPHTPYQVEEPYFSAIDRKKLPKRIRHEDCFGKPAMHAVLREYQNMDGYSEQEWDELRATYYAMCMKVDEQFGRLCEALKSAGIYDDCAIFVLSDHGDFNGDYGIPEKAQNCFEECLISVPFLVKPPKEMQVDPGISDSLVELVDFYATAMEFAQIKPDHTHFGKSLMPVLENRQTKIRNYVFCEGGRMPDEKHCTENHNNGANKAFVYWPRQQAQSDDFAHAKATMIRGERYKYIKRSQGNDEFYDLFKDPNEKTNQISTPEYSAEVLQLKEKMLDWYQDTCDIVPFDYDARFSKEMLWSMVKPKIAPEHYEDVQNILDNGGGLAEISKYM